MRLSKVTASLVIGGALTIALSACAGAPKPETPRPPTIPFVELKPETPADLLTCAREVEPFSPEWVAMMPPPVRDRFVQLAEAFRLNGDQLNRLVNRTSPGSCGAER